MCSRSTICGGISLAAPPTRPSASSRWFLFRLFKRTPIQDIPISGVPVGRLITTPTATATAMVMVTVTAMATAMATKLESDSGVVTVEVLNRLIRKTLRI